jgi:hypothetical protein
MNAPLDRSLGHACKGQTDTMGPSTTFVEVRTHVDARVEPAEVRKGQAYIIGSPIE